MDSTFEFLFREINYNLFWLGKPRPHIGATINMGGDTSQAYAGFTWDYKLPKRMFFNFSWGMAYHNGDTIHSASNVQTDKKELGSNLLFREAVELGWNFYGQDSISLRFDTPVDIIMGFFVRAIFFIRLTSFISKDETL